jgi:hypothetical protein
MLVDIMLKLTDYLKRLIQNIPHNIAYFLLYIQTKLPRNDITEVHVINDITPQCNRHIT